MCDNMWTIPNYAYICELDQVMPIYDQIMPIYDLVHTYIGIIRNSPHIVTHKSNVLS